MKKMKTLQLQINIDYPVTLLYDHCKSGESQYGIWHLYGVDYIGEDQSFFADEVLHLQLKKYAKGTKLVIRRSQDKNGIVEWQVVPVNGSNNSNTKVLNYLDDRSKDIHRQVALKIATISLGQNNKPWIDNDFQEIKGRMDKLLNILDGGNDNEQQF